MSDDIEITPSTTRDFIDWISRHYNADGVFDLTGQTLGEVGVELAKIGAECLRFNDYEVIKRGSVPSWMTEVASGDNERCIPIYVKRYEA